jgi:HEAT repeat protein
MSARRVLIETISANAGNHIPELGAQLIDQRWYYVRNVVSILAATHSPEALVHLQRTLRHGDARVRRETIRGLASIRTAMSDSMLMTGLDDADAQNVQVAANYLGSLKCVSAVAALELVARGQNRGSHDQVARVAAIEALSRIGEPSSVAVFRECSQKRGFLWFGAGQDKELRAAALAALGAAQSAPETKGTAS